MSNNISVSRQCLFIEGLASDEIKHRIRHAVNIIPFEDERVCFITFSYADIPIGFQYDVMFLHANPKQFVYARCIISSVTQQYLKPFPNIPEGWKTITLLSFPDGVPDLINNLPVVGSWYESRAYVCLSSKETWKAVLAEREKSQEPFTSEDSTQLLMNNDKWYIEPIWAERYMALSMEDHPRVFEIEREFGGAKRLFPHSSIMAATLSDQIKSVEMWATNDEPQVIMKVTYGTGEVLLGDVRLEIVPQMKQWVSDVNVLIEDARIRKAGKSS